MLNGIETCLHAVDLMFIEKASNAYAAPTCKMHHTEVAAYALTISKPISMCFSTTIRIFLQNHRKSDIVSE